MKKISRYNNPTPYGKVAIGVDFAFNFTGCNNFLFQTNNTVLTLLFISRSTSASVIISITDVNDECPYFMSDQYAGQISLDDTYVFEDGTANRLILIAEDLDSVSNLYID